MFLSTKLYRHIILYWFFFSTIDWQKLWYTVLNSMSHIVFTTVGKNSCFSDILSSLLSGESHPWSTLSGILRARNYSCSCIFPQGNQGLLIPFKYIFQKSSHPGGFSELLSKWMDNFFGDSMVNKETAEGI